MRSYIKYGFALLIVLVVAYGAFIKYGPVKPFPTNAEVAKSLNISEQQILGVYELADNYRYVAYTQNEVLHQSYWAFHHRKWQQAALYSGHEIMLVTIGDTKTFTWNFKGEGMHTLNVFAVLERDALWSSDEDGTSFEQYFPQIVLKESMDIDTTNSHGIFTVPEQWHEALNRKLAASSAFDAFSFFDNEDFPVFKWEVRDANGKVVQTDRPAGTSGTTDIDNTDMTFEYVSYFEAFDDYLAATNYIEQLGYTIEVFSEQNIVEVKADELQQPEQQSFWSVQQTSPEQYIGKELKQFIFIVKNHPLAEEVLLTVVVDNAEVIGGTSTPYSDDEQTSPYFSLDGTVQSK